MCGCVKGGSHIGVEESRSLGVWESGSLGVGFAGDLRLGVDHHTAQPYGFDVMIMRFEFRVLGFGFRVLGCFRVRSSV